MEITLFIMENHGKIIELFSWISVGTLYDLLAQIQNNYTQMFT